jgi:hypothetical protein
MSEDSLEGIFRCHALPGTGGTGFRTRLVGRREHLRVLPSASPDRHGAEKRPGPLPPSRHLPAEVPGENRMLTKLYNDLPLSLQ